MWLVTKGGFYSIVYKPENGPRLTIRARVRDDLVALKRDYLPKLSRIVELNVSDYPYRAFASRQDVGRAVGKIASEIDYPNFKDEIALEQGAERAKIYHWVWVRLLDLEEIDGKDCDARVRSPALQADR